MICHNAKTNSKYEQCSYVKQPREKASAYVKSDSFEKPQERKNVDNVDSAEHSESNPYIDVSDVEESNLPKKNWNPTIVKESSEYSYPSEDQPDKRVQDELSAACKQIQRDSKTCMVCKDPKIGGVYEKCTYNHQPSDKLYKYSRSKSFGYPDKISNSDSAHDLNKTQTLEKSKRFDYPQSSESMHDYLGKSIICFLILLIIKMFLIVLKSNILNVLARKINSCFEKLIDSQKHDRSIVYNTTQHKFTLFDLLKKYTSFFLLQHFT